MIYTVTFNPAIDYVVELPELALGAVNRTSGESIHNGGKGINVSMVLKNLGIPTKALGFIAGFTGDALEQGVNAAGVATDFIRVPGMTRINVKLKSAEETEINGKGPDIPDWAVEELFAKLGMISEGDYLVLAGAIPAALPADTYERILAKLEGRGIHTVVDATKDLLLNVLKYKPFLVKPNNHELAEMFNVELTSDADVEKYARKLQEMGAVNVLVSMAGDGALLIDEDGACHRQKAAEGKVVNSVGAGDSMIAGFLASYTQNKNYEAALRYGAATGAATAFSKGLATFQSVEEILVTI